MGNVPDKFYREKQTIFYVNNFFFSGNRAISFHFISFIFIPWIRTGLQNPYGYGSIHICIKIEEVKSI